MVRCVQGCMLRLSSLFLQDIFIKMMDFIRNYDPGSDEYTRRIRFIGHDSASNELARKILEVGEIKINDPKPKDQVTVTFYVCCTIIHGCTYVTITYVRSTH